MFKLQLIDLECNLLNHAADLIKRLDKEKVVFVSANRRPIRFVEQSLDLNNLLKTDFYVLDELVADFVLKYSEKPLHIHTPLERYFFVLEILLKNDKIFSKFDKSPKKLFPWAKRVANLFDEIDKHRLSFNLQNFEYLEVLEQAKVILEHLKNLYEIYKNEMLTKNITYRGDLYSKMLDILKNNKIFDDFKNHAFIITNLVYISDTEAEILKELSKISDVYFLVHHDVKQRDKMFDCFKAVEQLKEKLKPSKDEIEEITLSNESCKLPEIHFYSYPDKTTEMDELSNILLKTYENKQDPMDTAIILPDESSIMPLLINLPENPDINVNITMGYPFVKTPFYIFMTDFFELLNSINKNTSNKDEFKIEAEKILPIVDNKNIFKDEKLRNEFEQIRNIIFDGLDSSYIFINKNKYPSFYGLIDNFLKVTTIKELITTMESLIELLYTYKSSEEKNILFKINTINLFIENFIDALKKMDQSLKIDIDLCYMIFKELSKDLAIPFEGTPLRGLQIMGILESRGLKFKNVFLPDMNEEIIPSVDKIDPLLPEEIKRIIGLPSFKEKEILMRYNFYRILYSSEKVHIFYLTGSDGMNKAMRSRYVEQLLFMKELQEEKPLSNTINKFTSDFYIPKIEQDYVKKNEEDIKIDKISSTVLDTYLSCPYKYYLKYVKDIKPAAKFIIEFEHDMIGNLIHLILKENTVEGKTLKDSFNKQRAFGIIDDLRQGKMDSDLSNYIMKMDEFRYKMLVRVLKYRFDAFLNNEINNNPVFLVEEEFSISYNAKYNIVGRIDRADKVDNNKLRIIDYKTGSKKIVLSKNKIKSVLEKIDGEDFKNFSRDNLMFIKDKIPSVQLLVYRLLLKSDQNYKDYQCEAMYYYFGLDGDKVKDVISEFDFENDTLNTDPIIYYLIDHLEKSEYYYPLPGKNCSYCDYNKMCRFGE